MRSYWAQIAFCARYGHQPISELRRLTSAELRVFQQELADLLREEPFFTLR